MHGLPLHGLPLLSDAIEFEVPTYAASRRFAALLRLTWTTSVEELEDSTLIIVELGPEPMSFARLLRLVEEWVCEESLGAIHFSVDGRDYLLEAGEFDWPVVDATAAA
jgi:hypothetical protein